MKKTSNSSSPNRKKKNNPSRSLKPLGKINSLWIYGLIFPLYQLGITLYFLGHTLYSFLNKLSQGLGFFQSFQTLKRPIPPLPKKRNTQSGKYPLVWIHAVSGGEVKLADKIIREFFSPSHFGKSGKVLLTYCSRTGKDMAEKLLLNHPHLITSHLPIDFYPTTRSWVQYIKENYQLIKYIVIEHDFWPNWLRTIKGIGAQRIGLNYFLKTRDYAAYYLFPPAYHFVHDLDVLLTQNQNVSQEVMGFKPRFPVITAGNLKYGFSENLATKKLSWKSKTKKITITLGSSHVGEEELFLQSLSHHYINPPTPLRLVIIPRHPERAKSVGEIVKQFSTQIKTKVKYQYFSSSKKSNSQKITNNTLLEDMVIVEEMGWSEYFYQISDIVIIGDTFIPSQGGHNFLEPLAYGKCVLYGPYQMNYGDITPSLEEKGAVIRISQEHLMNHLTETLDELIANKSRRLEMGKKGLSFIKKIKYDHKIYRNTLTLN